MTSLSLFVQRVCLSPAFLFLCAAISFWLGLGSIPLFDLDEGAFTEATREMLESGVFSATYLDGEPRYDKPIFFYWIQATSISLFGFNEWAFRLPSTLAACLWAWALFCFVREQFNTQRAHIATLFLINCIWVALIARSAIADALLNLFLSLTLFDIWRYIKTKNNKYALRLYLWMALGTITKGPVAVAVPLAVSFLYLISKRQLLDYLKAYFNLAGWAIYFAVVSPWLIAVYMEQGAGFFEGFILEHNLKRFSSTRESHGGTYFYYVVMLPIIILPLSGLLIPTLRKAKFIWQGDLQRFLMLWFAIIFCLFSFSKTQLPHYILNACVPLIILLATIPKLMRGNQWVCWFGVAAAALFVFLPELLSIAAESSKGYDGAALARFDEAIPATYRAVAIGCFALILCASVVPRLKTWQRLAIIGAVLNGLIFTQIVRTAWNLQQAPIHHAIAYLEANYPGEEVVAYRMHMPTFSVYRQRITPLRAPSYGEIALVRVDRVGKLADEIHPAKISTLFQSGGLMLVKVDGAKP